MKKCALGVAAAFVVGAGASAAQAASLVSIAFQENGYNGNATVFQTAGSGGASFSSSTFGSFGTLNISATGYPNNAPPEVFDSNTLDVANVIGGLHTLNVYVTSQDNFSPINGVDGMLSFTSFFSTNQSLTTGWKVTETAYVDPANNLYGGASLLGTATFIGGSGIYSKTVNTSAYAGLTGPYSLTQIYSIEMIGTGSANSNINLAATTPVPEPETYAMMLAGLGLMGFIARRRKKLAAA
jgi:hypothetical protein